MTNMVKKGKNDKKWHITLKNNKYKLAVTPMIKHQKKIYIME